jgi:transcriptional regulator CtsR
MGERELSDLLKYSMQLAMLKQLLDKKLITEKEYSLVKSRLMRDYKILSNITSVAEKIS